MPGEDDRTSAPPGSSVPPGRLHVSAFGIHTGGGGVLLDALLRRADPRRLAHLALDARLAGRPGVPAGPETSFVPRRWIARAFSSLHSAERVEADDVLLCFNSLPPLARAKGRVVTYVHAPHLAGLHRGTRYSRVTALRLVLERLWFRLARGHSGEYWVQTESMQDALRREYPDLDVAVVPFVDEFLHAALPVRPSPPGPTEWASRSFFYPAERVGHKNHGKLLQAWRLLAERGAFPRLRLTLDARELSDVLLEQRMAPLANVEAAGHLPREAVLDALRASSALVFPSIAETFGLPLLEARALGIPIVASERAFVRDVCVPAQTFDPTSARSIADALARFVGEARALPEALSAAEFLARLMR